MEPLAMHRYQQWRRSHGGFSDDDAEASRKGRLGPAKNGRPDAAEPEPENQVVTGELL